MDPRNNLPHDQYDQAREKAICQQLLTNALAKAQQAIENEAIVGLNQINHIPADFRTFIIELQKLAIELLNIFIKDLNDDNLPIGLIKELLKTKGVSSSSYNILRDSPENRPNELQDSIYLRTKVFELCKKVFIPDAILSSQNGETTTNIGADLLGKIFAGMKEHLTTSDFISYSDAAEKIIRNTTGEVNMEELKKAMIASNDRFFRPLKDFVYANTYESVDDLFTNIVSVIGSMFLMMYEVLMIKSEGLDPKDYL
jgi:hypothetical protein